MVGIFLACPRNSVYTVSTCGFKWQKVERRKTGVPAINPQVELMFLGEYRHSMDDKGRLTVPARYRQLLEDGGYITEGIDPILIVLQKDTFERLGHAITQLSFTDPEVREFGRLFFSRAERIEADGSGRILVPQFLRERHGLNGEVVMVGAGSHFELWSLADWAKQSEKLDKVQNTADYFAKLNLFMNQSG